jgi:hypothetical protein
MVFPNQHMLIADIMPRLRDFAQDILGSIEHSAKAE